MLTSPLTLVVLAAGGSTRYGGLKQLDPIGPGGAALLEYALFDAARGGFERFVLVIQGELEGTFRRQLAPAIRWGLDLRFVSQPTYDPDFVSEAEARTRPWGTGFAVLAARRDIVGSFAVCNADDFYGRAAFQAVGDALRASDGCVLVSYPLGETLSDGGGVSRGVCVTEDGRRLERIQEGLGLHRVDGAVHGIDVAGSHIRVPLDTPVSMNLWGFGPSVLDALGGRLAAFFANSPGPEDEFYLSEAIGDLVSEGELTCRILDVGEGWLGVTFPDDRERVAQSLAALVDSGVYPAHLWRSPPGDKDLR